MKVRNKKTGEIVEKAYIRESHDFYNKMTIAVFVRDGNRPPERVSTGYNSLAELNEEWEDYEEPKKYYYITSCGEITHRGYRLWENESVYDKKRKEIGNYFETKEEAEKVVEKLKAWKRLKDKNFHFLKYSALGCGEIEFSLDFEDMDDEGEIGELQADLDLLFGGEE